MCIHKKYINPFTDYGFKKILGDEENTELLPDVITDRKVITEKAFKKAEFLNLPKVEQDKYHKNLKVYRDLFNSFETAYYIK
jgi:hypothetical protein